MLRSDIYDKIWFFDLEWVPDAELAKKIYGVPEGTSEAEAFEVIWARNGATPERPRPFIKYLYSRVVSIAFLTRYVVYDGPEPRTDFKLHSLPSLPAQKTEADEAKIILDFLDALGRRKPQLVGFNSAESDVQVLIQRGLVNKISAPAFCERPTERWDKADYFARWDNEFHLDMLKLFSSGGNRAMTPGLNEMAKLCGFPGKLDIDGQQVADLWLAGELDQIIQYNQIDALNTYLVWLRIMYFCGKLTEPQYEFEIEGFRQFLVGEAVKEGKPHINAFLEKWPEQENNPATEQALSHHE
jgi:predicted PolB exonuclease-like 3'-5' exonuclease